MYAFGKFTPYATARAGRSLLQLPEVLDGHETQLVADPLRLNLDLEFALGLLKKLDDLLVARLVEFDEFPVAGEDL